MDELAAFLNARLDEDEAAAQNAARADGKYGGRPHWSARYDPVVTDAEDPDWAVLDLSPVIEDGQLAAHVVRHDPARVLREVEAKRAILDGYREALQRPYDLPPGVHDGRDDSERLRDEAMLDAMQAVAGALATIWSDHPDYRPEWKP